MPCRIGITMSDGSFYEKRKDDYEGFYTRPMNWDTIQRKFENLAEPYTEKKLRKKIIDIVRNLENSTVRELMELLVRIRLS